jgi:hypothetical protein
MVVPELAKAMVEDRLRDAQKTRRFPGDARPRGLAAMLRSFFPHFPHL